MFDYAKILDISAPWNFSPFANFAKIKIKENVRALDMRDEGVRTQGMHTTLYHFFLSFSFYIFVHYTYINDKMRKISIYTTAFRNHTYVNTF